MQPPILVWVACATGELVALPAAGGPAAKSFLVERDLRDVIVGSGLLTVTKFRSAEVLRIASNGTITRRDPLPSPDGSFAAHVAWRTVAGPSGTVVAVHQAESTSSVAVHQAESTSPGPTTVQGSYGGSGGCTQGGISFPGPTPSGGFSGGFEDASVFTFDDAGLAVSVVDAGSIATASDAATQGSAPVEGGAQGEVAVDAGVTTLPGPMAPPQGSPSCLDSNAPTGVTPLAFFSSATPSNGPGVQPPNGAALPPPGGPLGLCIPSSIVLDVLTALGPDGSVVLNAPFPGVLPLDVAVSPDGLAVAAVAPGNAFTAGLDTVFVFSACGARQESTPVFTAAGTSAQPIAVAFDGPGQLLVQTREPAELRIYEAGGSAVAVTLSSVSREDTGHDIFHTQAGAMIACASCHPEGRDDGHVWILDNQRRRTPSLQGTIAGTAPYHWPGDEANLTVLTNDVYTSRMSGSVLASDQMGALTGWVQKVPAPPAPASSKTSASTRGKALFERADVGCATCHSGPKYTNNKTVDVGTGGSFQVPPLVGVGWRTPLMHDGCAATIADRFDRCATAGHGSTGLAFDQRHLRPDRIPGDALRSRALVAMRLAAAVAATALASSFWAVAGCNTGTAAGSPDPAPAAVGGCSHTQTDPHNCGTCGHDCGDGACQSGVCVELAPRRSRVRTALPRGHRRRRDERLLGKSRDARGRADRQMRQDRMQEHANGARDRVVGPDHQPGRG